MGAIDRRQFMASLALAGLAASAGRAFAAEPAPVAPPIRTGGVRLIDVDGRYKVWTKRVGAGRIKLLTLHGGPGCTHEYFECFEDFLPAAGVEFYYYDQLGSAYSDQPQDASLWTIPRFLAEVEQVRSALGLDEFYLYGHSWGGLLGIEYALRYGRHLKGLVVSNMTASVKSYVAYIDELRAQLPAASQAILAKYEKAGEYEAPEYQQVVFEQLYTRHLCRLDPWPDAVMRTFKHLAKPVYETLQGNNEFVVTGTMKDWDRWGDLERIATPTLLLGARHDEIRPADMQRMGTLIPNSRVAICENGSHLAMWDDQQAYFDHLLGFLRDVDAGRPIRSTT